MSHLSYHFEEVQLIYRNKTKAADRPKISCARDAYNILHRHWDRGLISLVEECKLMLLDNQLRVMSIASISQGGLTEAVVDPRIIFAIALKRRSNRLILAHNHPSGALKPSEADISLTRRLTSLGEMMRITLEDHLIISEDGFFSVIHDSHRGFAHEL
jgi:DNA repair protein RadC